MSQNEWAQLPEELRKTVTSVFQAWGLDFEETFLEAGEDHPETAASPYMTRKEAAKYARVSTDTIDNWCAAGVVEKSKLAGGRAGAVLIHRASLERFIRSRVVNRRKRVRKDYAPSVKGGYHV